MKNKTVISDWGGVLMRTVDPAPRLAWDRRLGLAPGTVERVVHGIDAWRQVQVGQLSLAAYWNAVARELDLTATQLDHLQRDFYSGDQLNAELIRYLRALRDQGIPLGLMSNNSPDLRDTLENRGLLPLFDAVVISAEIGVMKPDPAAYHAILNAMHVTPRQAIFIDDFPENVAGAQAVGMAALHYTPELDVQTALINWLKA